MFNKVVVANRGDVAARVIRALRSLGIRSVAVYSEADAGAPYLEQADESYLIGGAHAHTSYLNQEALLKVIKDTKSDAVHPGYGFLAENADFAACVENLGVRFIGPAARWIEAMSYKDRARNLMSEHGLPISAGSGVLGSDQAEIIAQGRGIGYPVLVKPVAGGGGIGMFVANDDESLLKTVETARSRAARAFSNDAVYLEKYFEQPRHIEFQILADRHGAVRHLFERDCSIQRRHQKVIEEAPAPLLDRSQVERIADNITRVLSKIEYDNIGTMEMLRGADGSFNFLEMNTRLQVEHAVTEAITGVDLVVAQILSSAGKRLNDILPHSIERSGHAIEARVYAEDPKRFLPSPGKLTVFRPPAGNVRVDTGYAEGLSITTFYDPLIAKIIAHGPTREQARETLIEALQSFEIVGVKTNIPFLVAALSSEAFITGRVHTGLVDTLISK